MFAFFVAETIHCRMTWMFERMYDIISVFQNGVFLIVALSTRVCPPLSLLQVLGILLHLIDRLVLYVMLLLFLYLPSNLFCFFFIQLLICLMLIKFSFVISECPVSFALFDHVLVSFVLPFIRKYVFISFFRVPEIRIVNIRKLSTGSLFCL